MFPAPSIIDNGDNEGDIIIEVVPPQNVKSEAFECVRVWLGNGACNRENNILDCNWDGGDCCSDTCVVQDNYDDCTECTDCPGGYQEDGGWPGGPNGGTRTAAPPGKFR